VNRTVGVGLLMALVMVPRVAAQSREQTAFLEGTIFAGLERRAHTDVSTPTTSGGDLGGVVPGGAASVGTWLTPRVSVRLEVSLPSTLRETQQSSVTVAAQSSGAQGVTIIPVPVTEQLMRSEQTRWFSTLVGFHTTRRHGIQVGYLGGAAFGFQQQRLRTAVTIPPLPAGTVLSTLRVSDSSTTTYGVTAEVGLDADISLARRLSIVPQVRALGFDGGLSVRPGVAVRLEL
jgi:hypothetical protein